MTETVSDRSVNAAARNTTLSIILALSLCHMLNDVMQSLLAAIYPMLASDFGLSFAQIGLLTLTFQLTASVLQPGIGLYTDKNPLPYSLPFGMGSTMIGLFILAFAGSYGLLLLGAAMIGIGSAIFHPESSRIARYASGGRFGMAQSVFQVGGNFGTAIGPLLAAFIVVPRGQISLAWFSIVALIGMIILLRVGHWYSNYRRSQSNQAVPDTGSKLPARRLTIALVVLTILMLVKNTYTAAITSYYTFFLIERFDVSIQHSQIMLFLFLGALAFGTLIGGLLGDRFGARAIIWFSILGILPFTLLLPFANLFWSGVLSVLIGVILSSAFPAIVVFAQELIPGRVGMIAGIFFGLAFGIGGIAAALLGILADLRGIEFVYMVCAFLPFAGLLTIFLPSHAEIEEAHRAEN